MTATRLLTATVRVRRVHRMHMLVPLVLLGANCSGEVASRAEAGEIDRPPIEWVKSSLVEQDSLLVRAAKALTDGRPWMATRLLAQRLATPDAQSPATRLLGAEAAAAWQGWGEVSRLLSKASWTDTLAEGRGRELLARAMLEQSPRSRLQDSMAAVNATIAVRAARDAETRAIRTTLLARALDRLGLLDSAASAYRTAAERLPAASDWLLLRAVAVTRSEGERARLLARVNSSLARSRRLYAEADARSRLGDTTAAAVSLMLAGDTVAALRLQLPSRRMSEVARAEARSWLASVLATQSGSSTARDAAELLTTYFTPLSSGEHLAVARSDATTGARDRALRSFASAFAMSAGTTDDRFTYATLLSRAGKDVEAANQFALVDAPRTLAASASYQRARSLLRAGRAAEAQRLLRSIVTTYADLSDGAANALYLLGDLASDAGNDSEARKLWQQVATRFPSHPLAPTARFRSGLLAFAAGNTRAALDDWEPLATATDDKASAERNAAEYWSGRALQVAGRSGEARKRWRAVIVRDPRSYYALLSAQRIGEAPWAPSDSQAQSRSLTTRIPARMTDAVKRQMDRAGLLDKLGFTPEATLERDALFREASASNATVNSTLGTPTPVADTLASRALAAAYAFNRNGFASRGILLAERALALGMPMSVEDWRLIYPVTHRPVIATEARRQGIDPALVAAVIRQESRFTPTALSAPGARGLMQIMPSVGRELARARSYPLWDDVLLYQPDISIELGTAHLAPTLRGAAGKEEAYALAAYNAGASRLSRWRKMPGAADPEMFIERIPFIETRDYVRIVMRNQAMYQALYDWRGGESGAAR